MKDPITKILANCLETIERGEMTLEECLARYPQHKEQLEPLLRAAVTFQSAPQVAPSAEFRGAARTRLLNLLPNRPVTNQSLLRHKKQIFQPVFSIFKRRFAMTWAIILTIFAILAGGGGVAYASEDALPGDALYPVKTAIEEARLFFAGDEKDAELLVDFAQERLSEIESLSQQGRVEDMDVSASAFEDGLERLLQTRDRVNYDDPRSEKAIAERIQQMTHTQVRLTGELEQGTPQQSFIAIRLRNAVRAYVPEGVEPPPPGEGQGDMLQRPDEPVGPPDETGPKNKPTEEPTPEPTEEPTPEPTAEPTEEPTAEPTEEASGSKPGNDGSGNGSGGKP